MSDKEKINKKLNNCITYFINTIVNFFTKHNAIFITILILIVLVYTYYIRCSIYGTSIEGFFRFWFFAKDTSNHRLELLMFISYIAGALFVYKQIEIQNQQRLDSLFKDAYELLKDSSRISQNLGIEHLYYLAKDNNDTNKELKIRVKDALCIYLSNFKKENNCVCKEKECNCNAEKECNCNAYMTRDFCLYILYNKNKKEPLFNGALYLQNADLRDYFFIEKDFKDVNLYNADLTGSLFFNCKNLDKAHNLKINSNDEINIEELFDKINKMFVKIPSVMYEEKYMKDVKSSFLNKFKNLKNNSIEHIDSLYIGVSTNKVIDLNTVYNLTKKKEDESNFNEDNFHEKNEKFNKNSSMYKSELGEFFDEVKLLFNLVGDFFCGKFGNDFKKEVIVIVSALSYLILPIDAIPDFLPIVGFSDDIAMLSLVISQSKDLIANYRNFIKQN